MNPDPLNHFEPAASGSAMSRREFEIIYRDNWRDLYDFAISKTRDKDVAEEIVQALFVNLWEKRQQLTIANPRAYLFTAVRNRIIDHFKEKVFYDLDSACEEAAPDFPLFLEELEMLFQEAMGQLPEKTRDIFLLNRFEGKSAPEIANLLKLPARTVEYHITQALRKLKSAVRNTITLFLVICNIIF
ncbi:RNA polymerase sigma-70 factor [Dyadobacter sp. Leaf189]|uniref:RNA polymerase sigma-70 factor n=1 Tax=Dyadobacter sp. Leaf189 TaxID=1736295 RepID=UPI001E2C899A|nr:RNA polymerase sigma-70 factor [Dyadobacter sp. Leaf189]